MKNQPIQGIPRGLAYDNQPGGVDLTPPCRIGLNLAGDIFHGRRPAENFLLVIQPYLNPSLRLDLVGLMVYLFCQPKIKKIQL